MPFSNHDVVPDSPINNFCTLNPLRSSSPSSVINGNLKYKNNSASYYYTAAATIALSGKHYWEVYCAGGPNILGIIGSGALPPASGTDTGAVGSLPHGYSFRYTRTEFRNNNTSIATGLTAYGNGDIVSFCFDADTRKLWYAINGNWQQSGDPSTETNPLITAADDIYTPTVTNVDGNTGVYAIINFGQDPTFGQDPSNLPAGAGAFTPDNQIGSFAFQPPAGALALCTANLPEGPIKLSQDETPSDNFKAVTWTGDGTYPRTISTDFAPDLIWTKARSASYDALIFDAIRGSGKSLTPSSGASELTNSGNGYLSAFNSDGFEISSGSFGVVSLNESGSTYVAWCWKAAGSPADGGGSVAGSAKIINEDGSANTSIQDCAALATAATNAGASNVITPSKVSANRQNGFSIVKYRGILDSSISTATIPHGLTSADFCIIKNLGNANTWVVSHTSIEPNVMALQDSGQAAATPPVDATYGQITSLNSDSITITRGSARGDNVGENLNSWDYIMYCWHSVENYSKCGSYVANGSTDGPYVECGFRPAWVMIKRTDTSGYHWMMYDSSRNTYNPVNEKLYANFSTSALTASDLDIDFLSSGFKVRGNSVGLNSGSLIFMAFAEQPFSGPSNAR